MSEHISPAAHTVLCAAWCEGNVIKLPPEQLEREIYEEVNEVIVRLGGKWKGGRTKGHAFAFYPPAPLLAGVQASGLMPPKNPTAFFPTPALIVADMLRAAESEQWFEGARVLEPSAGTGGIADAIRTVRPDVQIDCCEVLDLNRAVLESKGYTVAADDFLTWQPGAVYDAILMNPPFSVAGDKTAWATHLLHAWSLLRHDGYLACIVPAALGFRDDATHREIQNLVARFGGTDAIPAGAFKESGTGVATQMVWLRKEDLSWQEREYQGFPNWHQWALFLHVDNEHADSDAWQALVDRRAPDADVVRFLSSIIKKAREMGEGIAWDAEQQRLALAHYHEECGDELLEQPAQATLFSLLPTAPHRTEARG